MKKYALLYSALFFSVASLFAQPQPTGNFIQGTIVPGSGANSIYLQIKSNTNLTNSFLDIQFAIALPTSNPQPTSVTIVPSVAGLTYGAPLSTPNIMQSGTSFTVFEFFGAQSQPAGQQATYNAGTIYTVAEITFNGLASVPTTTRLIQLDGFGAAGSIQFYIANRGAEQENQLAQFFAVGAATVSNDGNGTAGSSFVTLGTTVLPIRLASFNTVKKDNNALVTWRVENQDANADRFVIERSFNGINFTAIGTTPVNVNGGYSIDYSYTDINIRGTKNNGVIYYRLRTVDKDGSFVNSEIKNIKLRERALAMSLYPNPAKTFTNLTFELAEAAAVTVNISDASGKTVNTVNINGVKGINQKQIEVANYPVGVYNFKIQVGEQLQTISVMKAN